VRRTDRGPWPDLVARLGAEEFRILLPQMPHAVASARVEAICQAVGAALVPWADTAMAVTCSLGAHWASDPADLGGTLAQAYRALYAAKARGRNQTVWEPALLVPPPPAPPAQRRFL
jgi:diguanylate cyclase (GGDEF)-like protein